MLIEREGGHGLEHGHLDELALAAIALAMKERGEHGVHDVERAGFVGGDGRMIGRRAVAAVREARKARACLDDVVVGGLA